jgi:hypothetical protein
LIGPDSFGTEEGAEGIAESWCREARIKMSAIQGAIFNSAIFSSIATDLSVSERVLAVGSEAEAALVMARRREGRVRP